MLLRSVAPRGQQLVNVELRSRAHQKRYKAFVRKTDDDGGVYYVHTNRKQRGYSPRVPEVSELFQMPNLLLDLDAEDARNIRSCDEEDLKRMGMRWGPHEKREAVKARVLELESQIHLARHKMFNISSHPTHIWHITPHDILSAAIRGAPADTRPSELPGRSVQGSQSWDEVNPDTASATTRALAVNNAIPSHAMDNDALLLHWLLIRQEQGGNSSHYRTLRPPSPGDFVKALKQQPSIAGIRRLVFRSLDAGFDPSSIRAGLHSENGDGLEAFSLLVRSACLRALDQSESRSTACVEALTFVGNLSQRLGRFEAEIEPALNGLALKLSAENGVTEAMSDYFYTGFSLDHWTQSALAADDVASALGHYLSLLEAEQTKSLRASPERQLLLQMLTGLDEDNVLSPVSVRSIALSVSESPEAAYIDPGYLIYTRYIAILGHLGAIRTLWREWHESAPVMIQRVKPEANWLEAGALDGLTGVFTTAFRSSVGMAVMMEHTTPPELSLPECVTLDYFSIDKQDPRGRTDRGHNNAVGEGEEDVQLVRSILDLPLDQYLGAFGDLSSRSTSSAKDMGRW